MQEAYNYTVRRSVALSNAAPKDVRMASRFTKLQPGIILASTALRFSPRYSLTADYVVNQFQHSHQDIFGGVLWGNTTLMRLVASNGSRAATATATATSTATKTGSAADLASKMDSRYVYTCPPGLAVNATGACCNGTDVDMFGACCDQAVDACGVCGGLGLSIDVNNRCCMAELDAAGECCTAGVDACGVCGGTSQCDVIVQLSLALFPGSLSGPPLAPRSRVQKSLLTPASKLPLLGRRTRPASSVQSGAVSRQTEAQNSSAADMEIPFIVEESSKLTAADNASGAARRLQQQPDQQQQPQLSLEDFMVDLLPIDTKVYDASSSAEASQPAPAAEEASPSAALAPAPANGAPPPVPATRAEAEAFFPSFSSLYGASRFPMAPTDAFCAQPSRLGAPEAVCDFNTSLAELLRAATAPLLEVKDLLLLL